MSHNPFRRSYHKEDDFIPPAGPPPSRNNQPPSQSQSEYLPPSGPPPPGRTSQTQYQSQSDYLSPSGPPPSRIIQADEFLPPTGPPPPRGGNNDSNSQYSSRPPPGHQYQADFQAPSGPPPGRQDDGYSSPSGPPPGRRADHDEYHPPAGPPPSRRYDDSFAPPAGPPPSLSFANMSLNDHEPPPGPPPGRQNNDWQSVPDTSLYPKPPTLGHLTSSTSDATIDDATRAWIWCDDNPLYRPGRFSPERLEAINSGENHFEKVPSFAGNLFPMKGGRREGFSSRWRFGSSPHCSDVSLIPTNPIYVASEFNPNLPSATSRTKTIYYEVQLLSSPSNDAAIALGFAAPPYPPSRLPGWHRGSLAVHGDDGRRYISDADGGRDFTRPFVKGERIGIGMTFHARSSNDPILPGYGQNSGTNQIPRAKATVFLTRDGRKDGDWEIDEEIDADEAVIKGGTIGLEGELDLFIAIGVYGSFTAEVYLHEDDWKYRP
jgi:hypothetical protein